MNNRLFDWLAAHNTNILVAGLVTFAFPTAFIRNYYKNNQAKHINWGEKKSCLTISFDCDYPRDIEAIPYLLKLLSIHNIKTSFACVGNWIEKYPSEHKMILEYGHEIMNHTYSHPDNEILNPGRRFKDILRAEKKEELERCHDICKKILHYNPVGCRIPHFKNLFTDDIYGILAELGYLYSSSTMITNTESFGMPFRAKEGIYEFPLSTCPKHPFTVFDTWHSFNSPRWFYKMVHRTEDEYIELFKTLVGIGIETNSYLNIYIDPFDIIRMKKFKDILCFLKEKASDLEILPYDKIIELLSLINSSGAGK